MAEGQLAGVAGDQVQGEGPDGGDGGQVQHGQPVVGDAEREDDVGGDGGGCDAGRAQPGRARGHRRAAGRAPNSPSGRTSTTASMTR